MFWLSIHDTHFPAGNYFLHLAFESDNKSIVYTTDVSSTNSFLVHQFPFPAIRQGQMLEKSKFCEYLLTFILLATVKLTVEVHRTDDGLSALIASGNALIPLIVHSTFSIATPISSISFSIVPDSSDNLDTLTSSTSSPLNAHPSISTKHRSTKLPIGTESKQQKALEGNGDGRAKALSTDPSHYLIDSPLVPSKTFNSSVSKDEHSTTTTQLRSDAVHLPNSPDISHTDTSASIKILGLEMVKIREELLQAKVPLVLFIPATPFRNTSNSSSSRSFHPLLHHPKILQRITLNCMASSVHFDFNLNVNSRLRMETYAT